MLSNENETTKKKNLQNDSSFIKEDQEKSDEDTEISNTDSNQSFDNNNFSVIQQISIVLNDFISQKEKEKFKYNSFDDSTFVCKNIPEISIEDYLNRIRKYTEIEDSTLIIALIYIDRFLGNNNIKLSMNNVHKILSTAVLLAIKYNEDEIYNNKNFAKIFGLKNRELNKLENKFLDLIDFKLFTSKKEFQLYYNKI